MSVSLAWKPKHFGGLNTNQLQLLYESILLGSALAEARHLPVYIPESQTQGDYSQEMPDFEAFRFYVNKVAQTCDNERGGDSITALAILKGSTGPNYVFGSNAKGSNELKATEDFVKTLLHLVGDNPDELKSSPLARRVLWFILSFNISRIEEYLDYLNRSIEQCREYCKRHNNDKGRFHWSDFHIEQRANACARCGGYEAP